MMRLKTLLFLLAFFVALPAWAGGSGAGKGSKSDKKEDQTSQAKASKKAISDRLQFAKLEADAAKRKGTSSKEYKDALAQIAALEAGQVKIDAHVAALQKFEDDHSRTELEDVKLLEKALDGDFMAPDYKKRVEKMLEDGNAYIKKYKEREAQGASPTSEDRSAMEQAKKQVAVSQIALKKQGLMLGLNDTLNELKKDGIDVGTLSFDVIERYSLPSPFGGVMSVEIKGIKFNSSGPQTELEKKYAVLDKGKAIDKLSADAVEMILRERGENSRRNAQDQDTIVNALYNAESFVDRENNRVRLSSVVLRPGSASLNRVYFTDRRDGGFLGLSIVSLLQVFNRPLPEDWGKVVVTSLDLQPLMSGLPAYYRVSEQVSFRSPDKCQLCISQTFFTPVQVNGSWAQPRNEQYAVQGLDRGFQRLDAAGNVLSGSDTISITKSMAADNTYVQFSYFNVTQNKTIFDAKVYFVDQKTKPSALLDVSPLLGGSVNSLRGFNSGPSGTSGLVELNITSPELGGPSRQIDLMLTPEQLLLLF